jgi:hypothetical protein
MKQRNLYRQMPRIACRWQKLRKYNRSLWPKRAGLADGEQSPGPNDGPKAKEK